MSNVRQKGKRDTHSEQRNTLLRNISEKHSHNGESSAKLLKDITTHVVSMDSRIGDDPGGSTSLAALVRNQKDVIDNKLGSIAAFLDKDNSQFHLKHHTTSNLVGNTSADGTGTHNHAHVDSNGVMRIQNVASVNVLPADTLNSGTQNDPANSLAVGVRARTTIADASTETFLKCDASGHQIVTDGGLNIGVKIADLGSTLNADLAGHSRSVAVGLRGRTNISDHTTGEHVLVGTDGRLDIVKKAKYESSYPTTGGDDSFGHTNVASGATATMSTIAVDTDRQLIGIKYIMSSALIMSGNGTYTFQGSIDGTTYRTIETKSIFSTADFDQASGGASHFLMDNDVMVADGHLYQHYRVQLLQSSGSTAGAKVGHTILYA